MQPNEEHTCTLSRTYQNGKCGKSYSIYNVSARSSARTHDGITHENAALHKITHNQNKIPNNGYKVNWQKQLKTTAVQPPNSFAPNRFECVYTYIFTHNYL